MESYACVYAIVRFRSNALSLTRCVRFSFSFALSTAFVGSNLRKHGWPLVCPEAGSDGAPALKQIYFFTDLVVQSAEYFSLLFNLTRVTEES